MTVTTATVYGLFFLAASAVVVLLALSAYVLGRQVGHERALPATLALVGCFTAVGAVGGFGPDAARFPVLVGFAFLYVPVGVGGSLARAATGRGWRPVCRRLIGGWMAALVVALASQAAGATLGAVVGWSPALFGVDWLPGFLLYMAVVGALAGGFTVALLARGDPVGVSLAG